MQFNYNDGVLTVTDAEAGQCVFAKHPSELRDWYDEAEAVAFAASISLYFIKEETQLEKAEKAKLLKANKIRSDFEEAISPPVEALGIVWNSGFDSSLSIDGAARIAQAAGLSEVGIHSLDNRRHVLSIEEATQVAIAIGGAYQQQLGIKQARMVTLDEIDLNAVNALELIGEV